MYHHNRIEEVKLKKKQRGNDVELVELPLMIYES